MVFLAFPEVTATNNIVGISIIIVVATTSYNMTLDRIINIPVESNTTLDPTHPITSLICNFSLMMARILLICLVAYYGIAIATVLLESLSRGIFAYVNEATKLKWPPYILNFSNPETWAIHGFAFVFGIVTLITTYYIDEATRDTLKKGGNGDACSTGRCCLKKTTDSATASASANASELVDIQSIVAKCLLMSFAVVLTFYVVSNYNQFKK